MILGITGSFGAGKGAAVDYLVQEKGFVHFAARTFIREEIERRGMVVDRDSYTFVGNELRTHHGPMYVAQELLTQAELSGTDAVIESLRAKAEVLFIQQEGGIVLGIDAPAEMRFARVIRRGSETDHVTFEKWDEQEKKEMNPDDPTKQDIFGALEMSDFVIQNDGNIDELHRKIDQFLESLT